MSEEKVKRKVKNCPHLGLSHDPETRFTYPAEDNFCHKAKPIQEVGIGYQGQVCLDEVKFRTCPVFQKGWEGKLPNSIRSKGERPKRSRPYSSSSSSSSIGFLWFFVILAFAAIVGLGYLYLTDIMVMKSQIATLAAGQAVSEAQVIVVTATEETQKEPTATLDAISILIPSNTPEPTVTEVIEATATEAVEETAEPSETPTPYADYSRYSLVPHFGPDMIFVLHQVGLGESLPLIARRYDTTTEMIVLLNCITDPIRTDQVFLVAPGRDDLSYFRSFSVLQPLEETPLSSLANEYFTTAGDIQYYNGWADEKLVVEAGEWVIVPSFCEEE